MALKKKYSKEYKLDAVSLVLEQNYTRAEAAKSLEITAAMLGRWVKEHQQSDDGEAFRGNGKLSPEQTFASQIQGGESKGLSYFESDH